MVWLLLYVFGWELLRHFVVYELFVLPTADNAQITRILLLFSTAKKVGKKAAPAGGFKFCSVFLRTFTTLTCPCRSHTHPRVPRATLPTHPYLSNCTTAHTTVGGIEVF
jgi:hypothetical protein